MSNKTKIILAIMIVSLGIGAAVLLSKATKKQNPTKKSYTVTGDGNGLIVAKPDTPFKKYDVVVVIGGLNVATPQWMLSQLESSAKSLLYSNAFIFMPHSVSTQQIKTAIENLQVPVRSVSIIGFSKGGESVIASKNAMPWRFVGLIDPAIGWQFDQLTYGKETFFTYGSQPMIDIYEKNGARYTKLFNLVTQGGGVAEKSVTSHTQAPKEFFTKFEKQINYGA